MTSEPERWSGARGDAPAPDLIARGGLQFPAEQAADAQAMGDLSATEVLRDHERALRQAPTPAIGVISPDGAFRHLHTA